MFLLKPRCNHSVNVEGNICGRLLVLIVEAINLQPTSTTGNILLQFDYRVANLTNFRACQRVAKTSRSLRFLARLVLLV